MDDAPPPTTSSRTCASSHLRGSDRSAQRGGASRIGAGGASRLKATISATPAFWLYMPRPEYQMSA